MAGSNPEFDHDPIPSNITGYAQGNVGLVHTLSTAYGFSTYTTIWTSMQLQGDILCSMVGNNIGFLSTTQNLYAYKPLSDRFVTSTYSGSPRGQDVEGSTIAFWTTQKCYTASMIWNIWHSYPLQNGEIVLGGGSAGMSAIFWTNQRAIAYNGGSGQWTSQTLSSTALGGIASEELGVVWTTQNVYAYSYSLRLWKSIALRNPIVSGSGNTAVARNTTQAYAFSRTLDTWYPLTPGASLKGGMADGDVAVVYTITIAYAFSQYTGNWYATSLVSSPIRIKAQGNAILVQTTTRVYGFSNLDPEYESWSSCTILGTVLRFLLDDYTGFLLTTQRIMAFKASATVNRWTVASYTGTPRCQDVQGATVVFWTNSACYATASVWSSWRVLFLNVSEYVQSGGSAGNFGLLWTNTRACAFSGASGNWMIEPFNNPAWNGLSENGVGMVWNDTKAVAFNSVPPNSWITDTLEGGFNDASASGSGTIGALWCGSLAHVYSVTLQTWIDLDAENTLIGGAASGDVAILWTNEKAYSLSSLEGTWYDIILDE